MKRKKNEGQEKSNNNNKRLRFYLLYKKIYFSRKLVVWKKAVYAVTIYL